MALRNTHFTLMVAISTVFLLGSVASAQTTWYVDCSVPGPGSGSAGDPFSTIQQGLDTCGPGDEVQVADGVCNENLNWPPTDGIRLYSADGDPSRCVLDAGDAGLGIIINTDPDGVSLTIQGIRVDSAGGGGGVGICGDHGFDVTIRNTEILNSGQGGIEAYAPSGRLTVVDSTIMNNRGSIPFGTGGGIVFWSSGELTVRGSSISENEDAGILAYVGEGGSNIEISENEIFNNSDLGIGIFVAGEGISSEVKVLNNHIYENGQGGAVILGDGTTGSAVGNVIHGNLGETMSCGLGVETDREFVIDSNLIFKNGGPHGGSWPGAGLVLMAGGEGRLIATNNVLAANQTHGVVVHAYGTGGQVLLTNNTVVNNEVVGIEEIVEGGGALTVITNCIVGAWDSPGDQDDLVNVSATYSNIEDGDGGIGNISADPGFVHPAGADGVLGTLDDDYHITGVPCQDAGSADAPGLPAEDMDGDLRDENPDIGADEVTASSLGIDLSEYYNLVEGKSLIYYDHIRSEDLFSITTVSMGNGFIGEVWGSPAAGPSAEWESHHVDIWSSGEDGHYYLGGYSLIAQDFSNVYNPPLGPFDGTMEVGESIGVWTYESTGQRFFWWEETLLSAGVSLTTPAGTFEDCVILLEEWSDGVSPIERFLRVCARGEGVVYMLGLDYGSGINVFMSGILVHVLSMP